MFSLMSENERRRFTRPSYYKRVSNFFRNQMNCCFPHPNYNYSSVEILREFDYDEDFD